MVVVVELQMARLCKLAQITLSSGGVEAFILHHSLRLQGYKLSSNHPFMQLLDGEYQVPVSTPQWCRIWKGFPYYAFFRNELFRNYTLQRYKSFLIWQNSFWGLVLWAVLPMIAGCLQAFAYLALQQLLGDCWHGCLYFSSVFSRSSIEGNSDFSSSIFLLVWYSATPRGCVVTRRSWICKSRLQNWLLL